MDWNPHITVATVIEKQGRFLLVEELASGEQVLNQPAGHLDPDESMIEAAVRETLEETGWHIEVTGLLGMTLYTAPSNGVTYYRTTFIGEALYHDAAAELDTGIIGPRWMTLEEVEQAGRDGVLRSPLVLESIKHYLTGVRFPLTAFY